LSRPEPGTEERLNVYDAAGNVVGAARRGQARASGRPVGAVNVLLVNRHGQVLLQRRPDRVENGGLWDKSVGGHVTAGEDFDAAALRETGEELFDAPPGAAPVTLAAGNEDLERRLRGFDLERGVLLWRVGLALNLRDVRRPPVAPGSAPGGHRNVLYHIGLYHGRSDVPLAGFAPQPAEIAGLRWAAPAEIDALLLSGELAPNMAFLWLGQATALLALARK
jgi:8-oxo-dGTP pyrophosphatase MutT (NUDIX family)